jgi:hypothetical protein
VLPHSFSRSHREELSRLLLEEVVEMDTEPTRAAIAYIKSDWRE